MSIYVLSIACIIVLALATYVFTRKNRGPYLSPTRPYNETDEEMIDLAIIKAREVELLRREEIEKQRATIMHNHEYYTAMLKLVNDQEWLSELYLFLRRNFQVFSTETGEFGLLPLSRLLYIHSYDRSSSDVVKITLELHPGVSIDLCVYPLDAVTKITAELRYDYFHNLGVSVQSDTIVNRIDLPEMFSDVSENIKAEIFNRMVGSVGKYFTIDDGLLVGHSFYTNGLLYNDIRPFLECSYEIDFQYDGYGHIEAITPTYYRIGSPEINITSSIFNIRGDAVITDKDRLDFIAPITYLTARLSIIATGALEKRNSNTPSAWSAQRQNAMVRSIWRPDHNLVWSAALSVCTRVVEN